jgi:O-antigen/teichoic acid export membrane protein
VMLLQIFQRQYLLAMGRYAGAKAQFAVSMLLPFFAYGILGILNLADWRFFVRAFAVAQAVLAVAMECAIARLDGWQSAPSLQLLRPSLGFGGRQYGTDVLMFLTARIDFFLVANALGNRGLGIYSVAVALSEIVSRMTHEIGTILFPEFASGRLGHGDGARVLRKTLLVAGLAALTTAAIGGFLIEGLFGQEFSGASVALRVLLLGTVAWSTTWVTWRHMAARGRPETGMLYFGAATALDVMLNIVLLPRWGILGASVASVASYSLAAGLFLRAFLAAERCTLGEAIVPTGRDAREVLRAVLSIPRGIGAASRGQL